MTVKMYEETLLITYLQQTYKLLINYRYSEKSANYQLDSVLELHSEIYS